MYFDPQSRRQFLGNAGKLALALPLLPSLLRDSLAAEIPQGGLIAIVIRNGVQRADWEPYALPALQAAPDPIQSAHEVRVAPFSAAGRTGINNILHDALPGLSAYRNDITLIQGLDSGSSLGGHGPTALGAISDHPSVDQFIAQGSAAAFAKVYGGCEPALRSLHLSTPFGPYSGASESFGSSGPSTSNINRIPSLENIQAAYDSLLVKGNPSVAARSDAALELVRQETQALRARSSGADARAASQYFDMISDLKTKLQRVCALTSPLAMARPVTGEVTDSNLLADLQTTLAVAAIQSRATRVVTIYIQGSSSYTAGAWHTDSHSESESVPAFRNMQRWVIEKYFLACLQKLSQAGLLQNSLVYLANDISHSRAHTTTNMPVLVGGHAGGTFSGGKLISYMRRQQGLALPESPGYYRGALMTQFFDSVLQSPLFGLVPSDYALPGESGFGRAKHPTLPDALYATVRPYSGRILPSL